MRKPFLIAAAAVLACAAVSSHAECTAASAERRVPLLELYTSEGCDSCPPADRWVSALQAKGVGADRVVVLAFHVDYWDRLGWVDRFAQARFTQRQRELNDRNRARVVYTPQLVLNGKDFRRSGDDEFSRRIADLNRERARASIRFALDPQPGGLGVNGMWNATGAAEAQAWLALYENRLSSEIKAGENRGKRLEHDYVVRELAGPFAKGALAHAFRLDRQWNRANLGVASFVQDPRSGDVLQAVAKPLC